MAFLDALIRNSERFADKTALEFIDPPLQRISYAELGDLVARSAGYLQDLGVSRGDRVALQLPKSLEFILLQLATLRLGAISLPLNPAYPKDEVEYFLQDSGARLFITTEPALERMRSTLPRLPQLLQGIALRTEQPDEFLAALPSAPPHLPPVDSITAEDTAVIVYTSGTTGRPKGAEITHANLAANLAALHTAWGWRSDDVLLHVLPMFHIHGLFVALYGALYAGATTLLMREFDAPRALGILSEGVCSIFMAVPTIHHRLLAVPELDHMALNRMRLITSGSDRLPDEVFEGFRRDFNYPLVERYGMTETGIICSNPLEGERRMGSVGLALPGVETRVADPETGAALAEGEIGEVQVRGPSVFKGYWQQPQKTSESFTSDGWFHTGDLGFKQPDGYVTLCGRSKDLIVSGGLNIYPPEVERVLSEHPDVEACAVIGCPDPEWGERVTAVVVRKVESEVTVDDLISHCRVSLASYKCPRLIVFRNDLPRNAMGKVQKADLRAALCGDADGPTA